MQSESTGKASNFFMPALYCIEIEGSLDECWSERLAGMEIKILESNRLPLVTTLSGRLIDQAELLGVLNALYNLRVALISVRRQDLPEEAPDQPVE